MNHTIGESVEFIHRFLEKPLDRKAGVVICPPYTSLHAIGKMDISGILELGAQNFYHKESGAFTGEISAGMLLETGVTRVIIGHSERRHIFHEDNILMAKKLEAAFKTGLKPILCIGETEEQRKSGSTVEVLEIQLAAALQNISPEQAASMIVAYEPVWAIGTGVNATEGQIEEAHKIIRTILDDLSFKGDEISILYGGSVKPSNAESLIRVTGVDGFLIGGASLNIEDFYLIYQSFN